MANVRELQTSKAVKMVEDFLRFKPSHGIFTSPRSVLTLVPLFTWHSLLHLLQCIVVFVKFIIVFVAVAATATIVQVEEHPEHFHVVGAGG